MEQPTERVKAQLVQVIPMINGELRLYFVPYTDKIPEVFDFKQLEDRFK